MQIPDAVRALENDLVEVFGRRLQSLLLLSTASKREGSPVPTLAVVETLSEGDLASCSRRVAHWHEAGLATPILMPSSELNNSLDSFPFEFANMLAEHTVVSGTNPFDGLRVEPADLRRACERQARSHLLHLREGYLETRDRGDAIAELIVRSAPPLAALVRNVGRLQAADAAGVEETARRVEAANGCQPGSLVDVVRLAHKASLPSAEARLLFPRYLDAVDRLTNGIDRWAAV